MGTDCVLARWGGPPGPPSLDFHPFPPLPLARRVRGEYPRHLYGCPDAVRPEFGVTSGVRDLRRHSCAETCPALRAAIPFGFFDCGLIDGVVETWSSEITGTNAGG
jgi:hypothetical protein